MILRGIAATTHVDRHNTKMTKEVLESMAEQINGEFCPGVGLEHDRSLPLFGKVIDAKVQMLGDGEYNLIITQEIFEEESVITLPDGSKAVKLESSSDRRPFITDTCIPEKIQIFFDAQNFLLKKV